jgi:hypothetical protein
MRKPGRSLSTGEWLGCSLTPTLIPPGPGTVEAWWSPEIMVYVGRGTVNETGCQGKRNGTIEKKKRPTGRSSGGLEAE